MYAAKQQLIQVSEEGGKGYPSTSQNDAEGRVSVTKKSSKPIIMKCTTQHEAGQREDMLEAVSRST